MSYLYLLKNHSVFILALISINSFCQSVATYTITFTNHWNETDHGPLPNNPHWSKLVGANHKNTISFVELGGIASQGIEDIAENGINTNFNADIITSITTGHSEQYINGDGLNLSNGSTIEITGLKINEEFPLLTLVSMIAPSPDWMIFVNGLNLRNAGDTDWQNNVSIDLYPHDAGTDSGINYTSNDADISSHIPILSLQDISPFNSNKVATIEIALQHVLDLKKSDLLNNIKIHPNPSNGIINISNIKDSDLNTIKVYSILGKLVKQISAKKGSSQLDINLSNLQKGLYLLKLEALGSNTIKKLIIK